MIVRPDGTERWMQSLGRADRDAAGQVTRLTGLELDITERRRTEEALQARRDEEHDRTLRTLLETATQGIVSADARGMHRLCESCGRGDVRLDRRGVDRPADRAPDSVGRFATARARRAA